MHTPIIDPGLAGKIVLITGTNNPQGIGAATARAFARLGCSVFLHFFRDAPAGEPSYRALHASTADRLEEEVRRLGARPVSWEGDLATGPSVGELFERAEAAFGAVAVLVNNAAHCDYDTFLPGRHPVFGDVSSEEASPLTPETHDAHFAVNSRAPALLMMEFARRHAARRATWGRIVNLSTDAAAAHAGAVSYGASKAALESYSRAAATELGAYGITVNVVAPGPIQTGWITEDLQAGVVPAIPLRRIGFPEDVADVIVFLASEQARYLTGQTLYVGGGHVMAR